jgi:hypothetical protein
MDPSNNDYYKNLVNKMAVRDDLEAVDMLRWVVRPVKNVGDQAQGPVRVWRRLRWTCRVVGRKAGRRDVVRGSLVWCNVFDGGFSWSKAKVD